MAIKLKKKVQEKIVLPPSPPSDPSKSGLKEATTGKFVGSASLKNLSLEQQTAVDSYLMTDTPVPKIIQIFRNEWKVFPASTDGALTRMLFRYKKKNISAKQVALVAKHTKNEAIHDLAAKLDALEVRLDPVKMLEELVVKQNSRLVKMEKTEALTPTLLDSQTRNIGLMGDLLCKLLDAQLETGVLKRVSKKLDVVTVDISGEERQFIENAKVVDAQASFIVDTMRRLRNTGVIDTPFRESDESQG